MKILLITTLMIFASISFAQEEIEVWVNKFDGSKFVVKEISTDNYRVYNERHYEKGFKDYTIKRDYEYDIYAGTGGKAYIMTYQHSLGYTVDLRFFREGESLRKNDILDDRILHNISDSELPYFMLGLFLSHSSFFELKDAFRYGNFHKLCETELRSEQLLLDWYGLWYDARNKRY